MHKLKMLLPLVALAIMLFACSKDTFFSNRPLVTASFAGQVIDLSGQPIGGAQVRLGGEISVTDANGVFRLPAARVPSDDAILTVSKIGYFEFSRAYYVTGDAVDNISIQLLPKNETGTVNAVTGGTVEMPGGAVLKFPADAFADQNGNAYKGKVRVYARRLDHKSPDFSLHMPGDLRGINAAGNAQFLANYGMAGVELMSQSGQPVRLRQGVEAELRMPIAPGQQKAAPSRIALWHYDLTKARWVEEGSAHREGNEYVGRMSHFSFWTFSTSFNLVELSGTVYLVDDQHPLKGVSVRLTMVSDSSQAAASTNAKGKFKGGVPMGEAFTIEILNRCGEVIYTDKVGPFSNDTELLPIMVQTNGSQAITITGKLMDCTGAPIKNGYAQVLLGNLKWIAYTGTDGSFTMNEIFCDTSLTTATIVGYDLQNQMQSTPDSISLPPNTLALGDITVCDSLDEYIKFSLDYNDFIIAVPVGGVIDGNNMRTFLNGYSSVQQDVGISIEFFSDGQPGVFNLSKLYVNTLTWNSNVSNISIEVLEPGYAVGDPISGTFEGTFRDQFGVQHTLSGSYQVRRDW
jgi:protocatechuate 3,4-dioxygenase beta subunit